MFQEQYYKTATPLYNGTTTAVGGFYSDLQGAATYNFYGQYTGNAYDWTTNYRGYIYAKTTGVYSFVSRFVPSTPSLAAFS